MIDGGPVEFVGVSVVVDRLWEIVGGSLEPGLVRAARMLVVIWPDQAPAERVVVLDAGEDRFVEVAGLPPLYQADELVLSDDGTRIVGVDPGLRLFVHTLA
ncbi:hypothetical protein, partial [Phytoactinopolyspora halophila]